MRHILNFGWRVVIGYEPVAARALVSSVFASLALGGIGTGALPARVEMGLALLTVLVPLALSVNARAHVKPTAATEPPAANVQGVELYRDTPLDVPDDPERDFVNPPGGAHRR